MRGNPIKFSVTLMALAAASLAALLPLAGSRHAQAQDETAIAAEAPQARGGRGAAATQPIPGVYTRRVDAHWYAGNTKFWYRNELPEGRSEFIVVDAEGAKRQAAFDQAKLAASLTRASGQTYAGEKLPFEAIEFTADGKSVRFTIGDATWRCELSTYDCVKDTGAPVTGRGAAMAPPADGDELAWADDFAGPFAPPQAGAGGGGGRAGRAGGAAGGAGAAGAPAGRGAGRGQVPAGPVTSPDGKWTASVQNNNVVLAPAGGDAAPLSSDGSAADTYSYLSWSPDSSTVVAYRMQAGDHKIVYRTQSSPPGPAGAVGGGAGRAVLLQSVYALPGDKLDSFEMNLFDASSKKQIKPAVERIDMDAGGGDPTPLNSANSNYLRWKADGFHFTFEKFDRGHQRVRVIEGDAHTGALRNIIDEKASTFIWTAHADQEGWRLLSYLGQDEIVYSSEISGGRHFYLVDAKTPAGDFATAKVPEMKAITKGEWVVRGVDDARDRTHPVIDAQNRVLYFTASGIYPDQDPYLIHYGHVNFDGSGLVWETAGNGNHTITYSPDYKYIIDSYDRVDFAGATELRRVSDGKLVCELEKTNVQTDWVKPEVFTAKARDGKTDIWGIIYKPKNFDATKKYPVIENIYAGPHGSFVPKSFALTPAKSRDGTEGSDSLLLNLGFVIVHIDGMGTAHRSRAFHDVCWQNLADAGFPDRILWLKAAAVTRPYMNLDRMGIFGTSAGGQSAAAALLTHPEFYKVAVANSGCHDNRMDKASWNEQWMGYPVGDQYIKSSNIENAAKLQGRLQLVVGELDTNVPPESTNRFVDALIKASKNFEYVMVPGADHGALLPGETIVPSKLTSFFQRYLQFIEPVNPNLIPGKPPVPSTGPGAAPGRGG